MYMYMYMYVLCKYYLRRHICMYMFTCTCTCMYYVSTIFKYSGHEFVVNINIFSYCHFVPDSSLSEDGMAYFTLTSYPGSYDG